MAMWCPRGDGEFMDGIEHCPDCGVSLVGQAPSPVTSRPTDDSALVVAGLRAERFCATVHRVTTVLLWTAAVSALGWLYSTWYLLDRAGGSFEFDPGQGGAWVDDGPSFSERLALVTSNLTSLVLIATLVGVAIALRLATHWIEFRLRSELHLDN